MHWTTVTRNWFSLNLDVKKVDQPLATHSLVINFCDLIGISDPSEEI